MAARVQGRDERDEGELPGGVSLADEIKELVETLKTSSSSWDRLVVSIDHDRKNRNRWFAGLAVGLFFLALAVGWILVRQSEGAERGESIKSLTAVVFDCTTPGGDCYERETAKQRARDAYQLALSLAVADCSSQGRQGTALQVCVTGQLTAAGVTLPPGNKP